MSIGEIISTPQGLAVVTQTLPTHFKVGRQTLSQVVAAPLTGGGAPYVPPPAFGSPAALIEQQITQQIAAAFVTSVANTPPPELGIPDTGLASTASATPIMPVGTVSSATGTPQTEPGMTTAAALAAMTSAYQTAAALLQQDGPQFMLTG